jgi:PhoH-like ATPase
MQSLWSPVDQIQAVFCEGKAGTGKTTLAVLAGAYEVETGVYDRIIYLRNAIPIRDIGFLPGDVNDKELPYMLPLINTLDMVQPGLFDKWSRGDKREVPKVEATTTAFTRGLTWKKAFIILDEAQNYDLEELQTVYTRCSDCCKVVTLGSLRQNDNRKVKHIAGKTPFEIYMSHFTGTRVAFHKLEKNYRGWFADHADDVMLTISQLEKG